MYTALAWHTYQRGCRECSHCLLHLVFIFGATFAAIAFMHCWGAAFPHALPEGCIFRNGYHALCRCVAFSAIAVVHYWCAAFSAIYVMHYQGAAFSAISAMHFLGAAFSAISAMHYQGAAFSAISAMHYLDAAFSCHALPGCCILSNRWLALPGSWILRNTVAYSEPCCPTKMPHSNPSLMNYST